MDFQGEYQILGVLPRENHLVFKNRYQLVIEECIGEVKYLNFRFFSLQRAQMYWKICQYANDPCFDWTTSALAEFAHQNKRHKGFTYP